MNDESINIPQAEEPKRKDDISKLIMLATVLAMCGFGCCLCGVGVPFGLASVVLCIYDRHRCGVWHSATKRALILGIIGFSVSVVLFIALALCGDVFADIITQYYTSGEFEV